MRILQSLFFYHSAQGFMRVLLTVALLLHLQQSNSKCFQFLPPEFGAIKIRPLRQLVPELQVCKSFNTVVH